jgi:hypothetical protein
MTDERRRTPLTRLSVARTVILVVVVGLAILAFTPLLGPFRIFFRGILILGVLAFAASYVWPLVVRIARSRSRD